VTQLSPHFSLEELTVTDTGLRNYPGDAALDRLRRAARQMEDVRVLLGHAIHVHSGYRSEAVNAAVGGVPTSDHRKGDAIDFTCPDFGSPLAVALAIQKSDIKYDQLIQEGTWIHVSFGPRMRQEDLTKIPGGYSKGIHA
jgi:hypothetical protein